MEAPRFQDWAEVHFSERRPQMTRPEFLEDNLRVILGFWGARPKKDAPGDPYHDLHLRLHDPIRDPKPAGKNAGTETGHSPKVDVETDTAVVGTPA